jgi:hypothetical protein
LKTDVKAHHQDQPIIWGYPTPPLLLHLQPGRL